jgi:beta-N-acetylhexosaminidase
MAMKKTVILLFSVTLSLFVCHAHGSDGTKDLEAQNLKRMVGQMLIVGFTGANAKSPGFLKVIDDLEHGIVGGVLFLYHNIVSRSELETMVRMIKQCACETMPLIAIDEEGGAVERLGSRFRLPGIPSAARIGKVSDADARRHYAVLAKKLADFGFNINFAPVVDLNKNPRNPVIGAYGRSFSADPAAVARYAKIFIAEHHAVGILTSLKHFPGHGSSSTDTHRQLTDVSLSWSPDELIPYRHLIEAGLVDTIMVGHLANSRRWGGIATQQGATAISQLLRRELKFDGVVICDGLTMRAVAPANSSLAQIAKSSVNAGADMLLLGQPADLRIQNAAAFINAAVVEGVQSGEIAPNSVKQAWRRLMSLKAKLQSMRTQFNSY